MSDDTPSPVRRTLVWIAAVGSILAALTVLVDNGEKLTDSLSKFWTSLSDVSRQQVSTSPSPEHASKVAPTKEDSVHWSLNALLGKWNMNGSGENILFESNGDVWNGLIGRGRFSPSVTAGANLEISYTPKLVCYYYVSIIEGGLSLVFQLREGPENCKVGKIVKAE